MLGIEIREHSIKAALVDTGCGEFVRPGGVNRINEATMDGTIAAVDAVIRAHNWRGPVGCSVTRAVWRTLGSQNAERVLSGAFPSLQGKNALMIHTDAAAGRPRFFE